MASWKLTKADIKERDRLTAALRDKYEGMRDAISDANSKITELNEKLADAEQSYREALADARDWRDEIASKFEDQAADMSDKWQEGDKASAVADWVSTVQGIDLDEGQETKIEEIEELDEDCTAADELDEITEEVGEC